MPPVSRTSQSARYRLAHLAIFPEDDEMAQAVVQSEPDTKTNEFLFRRLTVEDTAESHAVALNKAPAIGLDTFIISAPTPFSPQRLRAVDN